MNITQKIRQVILNQEKELENMLLNYFNQQDNKVVKTDINTKKKELISKIDHFITENYLEEAKNLLIEYKINFGCDIDFYSMDGIIKLNEGMINEAYESFFEGLKIDNKNIDILFNIIYASNLLGYTDKVSYYYQIFTELVEDEKLLEELNNIILNSSVLESYNILCIGINSDDKILDSFDKNNTNIMSIIEKENINYENKYYENGITVYETSKDNYKNIINFIIRHNKNCIILLSDISKIDLIKDIKENTSCEIKLIYYSSRNYSTDNKYSLAKPFNLYFDKELSDISDFIITDNINTYNCKKIIEERNNIYLIDDRIDDSLTLKYLLDNYDNLNENEIYNKINKFLESIESEYDKFIYKIATKSDNIESILELSKYVYENYNTQESYNIYLYSLNKLRDFAGMIYLAKNSCYCDETYKAEMIYLYGLQDYDLIDFISMISINNYQNFDIISKENYEYKIALYSFILGSFEKSYTNYMEILYKKLNVMYSPLVNRNIAYLMYASGNENYEKFYNIYKDVTKECLE